MSAKTVSTATLRKMKRDGVPIAVVTAYDYPTAKLAEEAGVDVLLVGDSLGNVVLGYESTLPVTLDDMIRHTRAVTRAVTRPLVVADMPFMTYHGGADETLRNVARLMREGRCHAVKVEGGREVADAVRAIVRAGVPVMGHIGLTPQSVYRIGGYRVQGKTAEQEQRLLDDALALEEAGVFAIVLELVEEEVARRVTSRVSVPTIGIGSGAGCDGQVLVFHDLVGYAPHDTPKRFVRRYEDLGSRIRDALARYVDDVRNRRFPSDEESFRFESSSARSGGEAG
ncbi:MAG: 3-methyl-2-oxobutanoate hydroxymethyltransferase [Candidatus Reconcilbacillus cellulovorans]|uniref:3-methyl-2-oxobutanoate hydroxymethyltransferase n=1 Tax=Candidatus Reconcilbacillus cellulovorans TaxID=1906605 RepID=A0A2A6E2Y2_9BACL|nr:MAG: 3-methyl-2-oxobutanoate hydroxymethyltransferase [Candidatus Reconcilbacillus cellulovorans]